MYSLEINEYLVSSEEITDERYDKIKNLILENLDYEKRYMKNMILLLDDSEDRVLLTDFRSINLSYYGEEKVSEREYFNSYLGKYISCVTGINLYIFKYPEFIGDDSLTRQKRWRSTQFFYCNDERFMREFIPNISKMFTKKFFLNEIDKSLHESFHRKFGQGLGYDKNDVEAYINGSHVSTKEIASDSPYKEFIDFYLDRMVSSNRTTEELVREAKRKHKVIEEWDKELAASIEEEKL